MSDTDRPGRPTWNEGLDFMYGMGTREPARQAMSDEELLEKAREFCYDNPGVTLPCETVIGGHKVALSKDRWTGRLVCKRL